jgi:hypothetical protein
MYILRIETIMGVYEEKLKRVVRETIRAVESFFECVIEQWKTRMMQKKGCP